MEDNNMYPSRNEYRRFDLSFGQGLTEQYNRKRIMEHVVVISFKRDSMTEEELRHYLVRLRAKLTDEGNDLFGEVIMPTEEFELEVGKVALQTAKDMEQTA
jgi:hypothetical protein